MEFRSYLFDCVKRECLDHKDIEEAIVDKRVTGEDLSTPCLPTVAGCTDHGIPLEFVVLTPDLYRIGGEIQNFDHTHQGIGTTSQEVLQFNRRLGRHGRSKAGRSDIDKVSIVYLDEIDRDLDGWVREWQSYVKGPLVQDALDAIEEGADINCRSGAPLFNAIFNRNIENDDSPL